MATLLIYVLILGAAPDTQTSPDLEGISAIDTADINWVTPVTPVTHTQVITVTPVTHTSDISDTLATLLETSLIVPMDSFDWTQTALRILEPVVEQGYAFARLEVSSSSLSADTLILETSLYPGFLVTVTDLSFSGDFRTRPALLAHLCRFSPFTYSSSGVHNLTQNLVDADCTVLSTQLTGQDSTAILYLNINETGRANRIYAGAGYSGEQGLTGRADIGLYNLFGGRREIEFSWFQIAASNLSFNLSARDPYPFRLPFGIKLSASFRSFDAQTYHLDAGGGVFISNRLFELGLGYSFEQDRSDTLTVTKNLGTTRLSTDILEINLRAGQRRSQESHAYLKTWGQAWVSLPLLWGFSFAVQPFAGLVASPDSLLPAELIPAGGARSVRGYSEEAFRAEIAVTSRHELRWGSDAFYLYPFFDIGWINSPTLLMGYGAGVSIKTPIGRLELDAGLPWQASWTQAKLHLHLDAEF